MLLKNRAKRTQQSAWLNAWGRHPEHLPALRLLRHLPPLGPRLPGGWPSATCSIQGPGRNPRSRVASGGGRLCLPHSKLLLLLETQEAGVRPSWRAPR